MQRHWYLARAGQVFGPVSDEQLAQSVRDGRVLPDDQLNIAGQPNWWRAADIPGLLPAPAPTAAQEPVMADLIPAEVVEPELIPAEVMTQTIRVTCFACFREVSVEVEEGATSAHCPKCRSAIALAEPVQAAANPNQAAFAKLESKKEFKRRMQEKAALAQGAAANQGAAAAAGGMLGAIIAGG
jgi:hypothetical protein